mgnify:CR=1 FL=1
MPSANPKPLVGVSASRNTEFVQPSHRCSEKYLQAAIDPAGCSPIVLPALADATLLETYAARIDGLMLTGGAANVEPHRYDGNPSVEGTKHDPHRDATTLPLIRTCIERGIPVLGICLGLQEMNVAMGGTLHQRIFDIEGKFDHRMRRDEESHNRRYRPAHDVAVVEGGMLHTIFGEDSVLVNSLHAQGIDCPGENVTVEAVAPDGIIEAISVNNAPGFVLGVQWHAEWPRPLLPHNTKIFEAFGRACRSYAASRKSNENLAVE